MSILQLPTRPPSDADPAAGRESEGPETEPVRVRAGQHGEFEEHELIHLLDSIDDERARARFRESVYISIIVWLAVLWFLIYGPRVIFHQPYYRDPIALMKEHDKEQLTYLAPTAPPMPRVAPKIDRKTMEALQKLEAQRKLQAPAALQAPAPPQPQPQEEAHNTAPAVPQPPMPLPAAPKAPPSAPTAPLPAAPAPNFARNDSPSNALANAMRGAIATRGSSMPQSPRSAGPLRAGTQILSDTQGVDFNEYMRRLHDIVQRNWDPLIPEEVNPPIAKRGRVGIIFSILPDGQIGDMKLETPSGDVALDRAAWGAIVSSGQFPPLPKAFHGPDLELRVGFFYNEPIE